MNERFVAVITFMWSRIRGCSFKPRHDFSVTRGWQQVMNANRWIQGSYSQGKSGNFEGVGENRGSGKSQGILKYRSLDQLFMHYFNNFCRLL